MIIRKQRCFLCSGYIFRCRIKIDNPDEKSRRSLIVYFSQKKLGYIPSEKLLNTLIKTTNGSEVSTIETCVKKIKTTLKSDSRNILDEGLVFYIFLDVVLKNKKREQHVMGEKKSETEKKEAPYTKIILDNLGQAALTVATGVTTSFLTEYLQLKFLSEVKKQYSVGVGVATAIATTVALDKKFGMSKIKENSIQSVLNNMLNLAEEFEMSDPDKDGCINCVASLRTWIFFTKKIRLTLFKNKDGHLSVKNYSLESSWEPSISY